MLGWSEEQIFNSSIKHIMKQIDIHMKVNNPKGTNNKEENKSNSKPKNENNVQVFTVLD